MKTGCPAALAEEPRADPGAGLEAVGGTRLRSGETRHMRSYRRPPRILDEHDREVPGDRIRTIKADRQSTGMKAHASGWRPIEPSWFTPPGVGRKSWPRPLSGDTGHYRNMTDALRSILQTTGPPVTELHQELPGSVGESTHPRLPRPSRQHTPVWGSSLRPLAGRSCSATALCGPRRPGTAG